jgi:hypothetical protein
MFLMDNAERHAWGKGLGNDLICENSKRILDDGAYFESPNGGDLFCFDLS